MHGPINVKSVKVSQFITVEIRVQYLLNTFATTFGTTHKFNTLRDLRKVRDRYRKCPVSKSRTIQQATTLQSGQLL